MTSTLTDLLNEDTNYPYCPACGGDGTLTYIGGPGWYSTRLGCYLPTERDEPCEDCNGTGRTDNRDSGPNAIRHHLHNLTNSQRQALQNLMHDIRLPITQTNYNAIEEFFQQVENEIGSHNPIAEELLHILDNATIITPSPNTHNHNRPRTH